MLNLKTVLEMTMMDRVTIQEKISQISSQREFLTNLLQRPDLGTLRIDVNQALEELDELMEEYLLTFPDEKMS